MFGKKHSDETKEKIRAKAIGRKLPENHFFKIGQFAENHPMYGKRGEMSPLFGRNHSEETKNKMSIKAKGRVMSEQSKRKLAITKGFSVINILTKEKYFSIKEASVKEKINYQTLKAKLSGRLINNTNIVYDK